MSAFVMVISAAAIVLAVKFGLLRGIDHVANAMNWSAKARGQVTGYATSVPEFVCLVSAGLAGVWEAGLWNIASIPETVSFFAVYAASRREGRLQELNDTQEVLDNLTGSNMANVGVVYPVGLLAYLLLSTALAV